MRLVIVLLTVMLAAPAGPAAAQGFKPPKFRLNDGARDMREGPGPDRWIIALTDRRNSRAYHIHLAAREHEVWVHDEIPPPHNRIFPIGVDPVTVARPGFRRVPVQGHQQGASYDLRRVRGGWRFRARTAVSYDIDLRIRSRGPGPTLVSRYPDGHGLLRRALPVMDGIAVSGRLTGRLSSSDRERDDDLRGWHVTIVHDWWAPGTRVAGRPACCGDPDVAVIPVAGGTIAVLGGRTAVDLANDHFNRPGWRGIIARRRGARLEWCRARRPAVHHQWNPSGGYWTDWMTVTGCGQRVRLRRVRGRHDAVVGGRRIRDVLWLHRHDDAASDAD